MAAAKQSERSLERRENVRFPIFPGLRSATIFTALLACSASVFLASSASTASAQSILIQDCQGFTRAAQQGKPGQVNKVEIQVQSQASQPDVTLENVATKDKLVTRSVNGVATFDSVNNGVYVASTGGASDTIGAVTIGTSAAASAGAAVAVGSGVVLLGGGAATGVTIGVVNVVNNATDSNSDDVGGSDGGSNPPPDNGGNDPGDGGGDDGGEPPPPQPPPNNGGNDGGSGGNGNNDGGTDQPPPVPTPCDDCKPDEVAPPLKDPFFDDVPVPTAGTGAQKGRGAVDDASAPREDADSSARPFFRAPLSPSS